MDVWVQVCRGSAQVNPGARKTLRDHGEGGTTRKVADATLPRKASREWEGYPYRKPTQVGEEKILRRE